MSTFPVWVPFGEGGGGGAEFGTSYVAAGSGQSDATPISGIWNIITGGSGGVVPAVVAPMWIVNQSGGTINVYPPSGAALIEAGSSLGNNTPGTLACPGTTMLVPINTTQWSAS